MKSIVTGLTCVALVAALSTWSLGDGDPPVPVPVTGDAEVIVALDTAAPETGLVVDADIELVAVPTEVASEQATLGIAIAEDDDGSGSTTRTVSVFQAGVADEEAKKGLERIIDQMVKQAEQLEKAGNKDEAAKKRHTAEVIKKTLSEKLPQIIAKPGKGGSHRYTVQLADPTGAKINGLAKGAWVVDINAGELKDLEKRLAELAERKAKLSNDAGSEESKKALKETLAQMEEVEKKLSGMKTGLAGLKVAEGAWTGAMPARVKTFKGKPVQMRTMSVPNNIQILAGGPEMAEIHARAAALEKAAQALKAVEKHDQAKKLMAEAEELRAKAQQKVAALAAEHAMQTAHIAVMNHAEHVGPELHTTLKELQEQVQLLRKEVAELKEMLKK